MKKLKKSVKFDYLILCIILLLCFGQNVSATVNSSGFHTVIDNRGIAVQIPDEINRVVTIDDGFGLEVMSIFGIPEKLIGVGSRTFEEVDNYDYQSVKGENFTFSDGMNTMTYLHPSVKTLPVIAEYEAGVNYESLAALKPDVVIVRLGECTFWADDENVQKSLSQIESLGIPVVVLKAPNFFEKPDIATMYDEIRILGQVFGKEKKA